MAKKVTIYDIADKLELSPSTVSRALSGNSLISANTRNKVRKAAKEMGYMDNSASDYNANTIAIVVPEINNHFYSGVLESIQKTIDQSYLIAVFCSYNSTKIEKDIVSKLNPAQIKCLVISQSMDTEDCSHLKDAEQKGINVILFNRIYYNGQCPRFLVDNYMDSYILTRHLVSTGRKRIALAAKHYNCPIYRDRIRAYKDVISQNGLAFNPEHLIYSELTLEDTYEVINRFIRTKPRPDAIMMPNFVSALQAVSIAKINNLNVPGDIAIVSFDEDPECKYSTPSITGVERPAADIGEQIARTVLSADSEKSSWHKTIKIFSSNLIIKGSSFSY